ncbi:NAD(P)-binding domain protein [Kalmanozyma brasiliensis GHG001]|uniref:PRISE-like Rossmann-fold domain-containing protein n=1 Tax=Kalmanozyma brasiliensis (strain GHG001) TaxID=1365824 RepID=V5EU18_KALBG|nr:NAD(P)-binding domain protein [Kalmanozyma brasiliensis GHG001]EST06583.1 NAD(P)-binding domain protein [Kalmanozyma brasiliensis GHG001]
MSSPQHYLVFGANGVSGLAALRALVEQPKEKVGAILAVSRRPPQIDYKDSRIKFISIDILNASVDEITERLKAEGGDKVNVALHYTYIEKKDPQELLDINHELLIKALDSTSSATGKNLRHFHLQTGYKWYSLHLANKELASPVPYQEDAPRGPTDPPNFYYDQVDTLVAHAKKHGYAWSETRPNTIIGAAKGNFMNQAVSTSLYLALEKGKGKTEVQYPGNNLNWDQIFVSQSTAINNARFQVFLTDAKNAAKCENQSFNIEDGDRRTLGRIWQDLGKELGLKVLPPTLTAKYNDKPPQLSLSLNEWSKRPENVEAWKKLTSEEGGDPKAFADHATFAFADFTLGATFDQQGSLDKARAAGWDVVCDTVKDGYLDTYRYLQEIGTLPKV